MEIERKWLVKQIPALVADYHSIEINQGYVLSNKNVSIRVRSEKSIYGMKYTLTTKSGQGMSRHEYEHEIDVLTFAELWSYTTSNRIEKFRFVLPIRNSKLKIEFDVFSGHNSGLLIAEVEFNDQDEAVNFIAPDWFGQEVTFDGKYTNAELSKN